MVGGLNDLGLGKYEKILFNGTYWLAKFPKMSVEKYESIFSDVCNSVGEKIQESLKTGTIFVADIDPLVEEEGMVEPRLMFGEYKLRGTYDSSTYILEGPKNESKNKSVVNPVHFGFHINLLPDFEYPQNFIFSFVNPLPQLYWDYVFTHEKNHEVFDKEFGTHLQIFGHVVPEQDKNILRDFYNLEEVWVEAKTLLPKFGGDYNPFAPFLMAPSKNPATVANKFCRNLIDYCLRMDICESFTYLTLSYKQANDKLIRIKQNYSKK